MKVDLELENGSKIIILRGPVTAQKVTAIVNAANNSLMGGSGVNGEIHNLAGPELREECRTLNGCATGKAKVTGAYNIKNAEYIIHAVGPVYHGEEEDAELLRSAYQSSLDRANDRHCVSIAFPCISAGIFGYPLKESAPIAILAVYDWLMEHPESVMEVRLCCYRDREWDCYLSNLVDLEKEGRIVNYASKEN